MDNAQIIAQLQKIGSLPADNDSTISIQEIGSPIVYDMSTIKVYPLEDFDNLLQQLTAPLTAEHALALLNLGPPPDTSTYEVEWALVHAAEIASVADLERILPLAADTEVTRIVTHRLANYKARQH